MKFFYFGLGLLLLFQLTTGFLINNKKTELSAKRSFEYYAGSESATILFENWKDRFIPQKTVPTIIKSAILHICMIGIFFFTIVHIAIINGKSNQRIFLLLGIAFFCGLINFLTPFLIRNSILWAAYFKQFSLLLFFFITSILIFVISQKVIRNV